MSTSHSNDRVSRCCFTFADGRQCRMPRKSGHPFLCCFHARREAQAQAAEEVGRDIRFFLSGDYLSACNLSLALGRVFAATARGDLKPKTAGTLAYLGQTLLQTIHHAEHEYINAFSTDRWRQVIHTHVNENSRYLFHAPAAGPLPAAVPAQTAEQLPPQPPGPDQPAFVEAGLEPGLSDHANTSLRAKLSQPNLEPGFPHSVNPSAKPNSCQAVQRAVAPNHAAAPAAQISSPTDPARSGVSEPYVAVAPSVQKSDAPTMTDQPPVSSSSPTSPRLPRRAAEFAATILASASSSPNPSLPLITGQRCVPVEAGLKPGSSSPDASQPARSSPAAKPVAQSQPPSSQTRKPPSPPTNNSSSSAAVSSQSSPRPAQASDLPGFGSPANWDVLIPQNRGPARRRRPAYRDRQIRPWHLPE